MLLFRPEQNITLPEFESLITLVKAQIYHVTILKKSLKK